MLDARAVFNAAVDYVRKNPDELFKAAVNAAGLRFGVPLAALRWMTSQATSREGAAGHRHRKRAPCYSREPLGRRHGHARSCERRDSSRRD